MYADLIPGELMMLKYYRRRLDIAASTNDAPSIKEIGADVLQIWSALRPAVEARGGVAEAQRFNDLVDNLENSGRAGQLAAVLRDRIYEIQELLK